VSPPEVSVKSNDKRLAELKSAPMHALAFELPGAGDSSVWLELDNVRFY
jgi:hypothetical protein